MFEPSNVPSHALICRNLNIHTRHPEEATDEGIRRVIVRGLGLEAARHVLRLGCTQKEMLDAKSVITSSNGHTAGGVKS